MCASAVERGSDGEVGTMEQEQASPASAAASARAAVAAAVAPLFPHGAVASIGSLAAEESGNSPAPNFGPAECHSSLGTGLTATNISILPPAPPPHSAALCTFTNVS